MGSGWRRVADGMFADIPEQTKMILKADIKYKSNWQQGALKGGLVSALLVSLF